MRVYLARYAGIFQLMSSSKWSNVLTVARPKRNTWMLVIWESYLSQLVSCDVAGGLLYWLSLKHLSRHIYFGAKISTHTLMREHTPEPEGEHYLGLRHCIWVSLLYIEQSRKLNYACFRTAGLILLWPSSRQLMKSALCNWQCQQFWPVLKLTKTLPWMPTLHLAS